MNLLEKSTNRADIINTVSLIDSGSVENLYVLGKNIFAESIIKNFQIAAVIDDFGKDVSWNGFKIIKSSDIPPNSIVISTSLAIYPHTALTNAAKHGSTAIHYLDLIKHSKTKLRKVQFLENCRNHLIKYQDKYESIYRQLEDDKSKDIFSRIIRFRFNFDLGFLSCFNTDPIGQYFEDFLNLSEEYFVDAGGFHGETSIEFSKHCSNYKQVYFFEPSESSMKIAKKNLHSLRDTCFLQVGLSNVHEHVSFDESAGSANHIGEGDTNIEVNTLDNLINEKVTFIKMDLEGYEKKALLGAKNIIKKNHPKLAISVYHKYDDLIEIPNLIFSFREDYHLFIRHYTEGTDETVMFFMPKKL